MLVPKVNYSRQQSSVLIERIDLRDLIISKMLSGPFSPFID